MPPNGRKPESIPSGYFSNMRYVDTYNVMARELGPIKQWSEEERALYILLLEQYRQLTDARLVYQVPGDSDLSRTQAVEQARNAVLSKFSTSEETLDAMTTDVIFAADAYNPFGVPESIWLWLCIPRVYDPDGRDAGDHGTADHADFLGYRAPGWRCCGNSWFP